MANYLNIPFIWPFKMIPVSSAPGIHFDDSWSHEQIKSWEIRQRYFQKWNKQDTTPLIIECTITPNDLIVYDKVGAVAKSIEWSMIYDSGSYRIFQLIFDISDLSDGTYFIFQRVMFANFDWQVISEPIKMKTSWFNTLLFTYKNSYNSQDVAWTLMQSSGMKFRCEGAITNFLPKRDRASYINQTHDIEHLSGTPYRTFQLLIGDALGVAPYVIDILNRVFLCDTVDINGKKYQSSEGSEWEIKRENGFPLIGASLELQESLNKTSLQFGELEGEPVQAAILVTYQIETRFFGGQQLVQITDYEQE